MIRKFFAVVIGVLILLVFLLSRSPIIVGKSTYLNSEETACFDELIEIGFDRGPGFGIIKITGKEANNIYLHLYTLLVFNKEWVVKCPGGSMGPKD